MAIVNPIEVTYQPGRQIFCFRVATVSGAALYYNTVTQLYEAPINANFANYVILIPEVFNGYYNVAPPTGSLQFPATEVIYEIQSIGVGPQLSDITNSEAIGTGNSQGVNIGTVNGSPGGSVSSNPSADVNICNLALNHLGQPQIVTMADATKAARRCLLIYANIRDQVIRSAGWKFSTILDTLVQLPNETVLGWSFVGVYPANCINVRKIFGVTNTIFNLPLYQDTDNGLIPPIWEQPLPQPFRVIRQPDLSSMVIVCNLNPAYIEYSISVDDPTQYDAVFIQALSYRLAADLAIPLGGNSDQEKSMLEKYAMAMSEAARLDGNEGLQQNREISNYVNVR